MKLLKEFFKKEAILKCFVFALFVSLLFTGRLAYVKQIHFFSATTFQIYLVFSIISFIIFIFVFFVLFWLSKREQKD